MLKLKEIKDPQFELEITDGDCRSFDAWKVQEDFNRYLAEFKDDPGCTYKAIRKAFGMPLNDEEGTFTRNQCLVILDALTEFLESLPVSKKAPARMQNLNG